MSGLSALFQAAEEKTISIEQIDNSFDANFTYNLPFDDDSKNNLAASTGNVGVSNGQLVLTSGAVGLFLSKTKNTTSDVSRFQVKVLGENLQNAVFRLSVDGGNNWDSVTLEAFGTITVSGRNMILEITFQAATVKISSVAVLYT